MKKKSRQIYNVIIRVPKHESAFVYFQLESHEGLCFYSTLTSSLKTNYRDLELTTDISLKMELENLLKSLHISLSFTVLSQSVKEDISA